MSQATCRQVVKGAMRKQDEQAAIMMVCASIPAYIFCPALSSDLTSLGGGVLLEV